MSTSTSVEHHPMTAVTQRPGARQGSNESERSEYDSKSLLDPAASPHGITELGVYHDAGGFLHSDLHIKSSKSETLYFVDCSTSSPTGYDLIMHAGGSKTDPIVGAALFEPLSIDIKMVIGDPDSKGARFETISPKSLVTANFAFGAETKSGEVEQFEWRRSHGKEVHSAGGKWFSMRNMALVRLADEQTVGVYVDNLFTGFSKKGKLQFRDTAELGKEGQFTAMLALLSINEKIRRNIRGTTTAIQPGGKFPF